MNGEKENISCVVVTDCGSTTTKALLFKKTSDGWRKVARGESPTTVENPVADVTVGVTNAIREVQEVFGATLLKSEEASCPILQSVNDGKDSLVDMYLSTSSAGGGLQMVVTGLVSKMTTESAQRAALGAGAIVLDAISTDEGREDYEIIERLRHVRPDIVLITGGVENGATSQIVEIAELIRAAAPQPRFGNSLNLPVVYAGNSVIQGEIKEVLDEIATVSFVENIRPSLDKENLDPAREAIHEFFLSHVMSHSPGYDRLLSWVQEPVMPTPAAVGDMVQIFSKNQQKQVLCADIGGATTDVFSVCRNREGEYVFNRTVSANYGMSYSIANVLLEAGSENIRRWLPYELSLGELRDRLRNKMIRPTSIPQTLEDLWLEQAVCREALRLSLDHHRGFAVGLGGKKVVGEIGNIFAQQENRYQLLDLDTLEVVIGSGGVLSHAPSRLSAAMMLIDGFGLCGVTELMVDSVFMMPHLGVFSSVDSQAALEIFTHDCIIPIGCHIKPRYSKRIEEGIPLVRVRQGGADGAILGEVVAGGFTQVTPPPGKTTLYIEPLYRWINGGRGRGKSFVVEVSVSQYGLLLDGRSDRVERVGGDFSTAREQYALFKSLGLLEVEDNDNAEH